RPGPAEPPAATASTVAPTALAALFEARSRAVLARDRDSFLASVDPAEIGFQVREGELFDALFRVRFSRFAETVAAVEGELLTVHRAYRLQGFDTVDAVRTVHLRHRAGRLVGDGGSEHRDAPDFWSSPDLRAVQGGHALVLGDGALKEIAAQLDRSVPLVSAVVGRSWPQRAVALAPADAATAATLAGGQDLDTIVALAVAPPNADRSPAPSRILISPDVWSRVNALGRRVVLTHELTHIALNSASDTKTPLWLVEGLADYIGYKGTGTPPRKAAKELTGALADGYRPTALPDRARFAAAPSEAYQESWLACSYIAETHGEPALLDLYRLSSHLPEPQAMRQALGTPSITPAWLAYLRSRLA
ncbi:basic secretory protein-like protein, partial [Actinocorallia lasiicapitis]